MLIAPAPRSSAIVAPSMHLPRRTSDSSDAASGRRAIDAISHAREDQSHPVRKDATTGAAIGFALGMVGGSLYHVGCDEAARTSGCSTAKARISLMITTGAAAGVIGAGIGALVGVASLAASRH
jgi:hypothetical protein